MWLAILLAAGPVDTLSLEEVLSATERAYPQLLAARADVAAAAGEYRAAEGGFDPNLRVRGWLAPDWGSDINSYPQVRVDAIAEWNTPWAGLNLFGGYRLGTGKIQSYYGERSTYSEGELRAGVSIPFPLLRNGLIDRRRATLARAELQKSLAGQAIEVQRLEVKRLAANRFFEWVAAGQRRVVAQSLLKVALDRDQQLGVRVRTGDVALFDQQDNQRAVVQREAFVVQQQRAVEQAAFELSLFLRDSAGEPLMARDEQLPVLGEPDGTLGDNASLDEALSRRPDVARLLTQREQHQLDVRLNKNQVLPSLEFGALVSRELGVEVSGVGRNELEFNALLDVPLNYNGPLGRVSVAEATLARTEAQLRLARDRVAADVRDALSALKASRERIILTRKEILVARALEQGERKRFELGDSNLLFVNIREQNTAEAQLREIDAMLDYHRATAAFRAAMALP
jgi:outer membrane protein, heavy metal efflux system